MIGQARQAARKGLAGLALAGALMALVPLLWQSALAAPQVGTAPTLDVVGVSGASVTLDGHNWQSTTQITLGYSTHSDCTPATGLSDSARATDAGGNFHTTYILPNVVPAGTYYLCATGLGPDGKSATIPSPQQIVWDGSGTVTLPPGSATPTNTVPVPTDTVPPGAPTSTPTPGASATSTTQATGPGNQGVTTTTPPKSSVSTLVAIIIVCLLLLASFVYLLRILLRGRRPDNPQ